MRVIYLIVCYLMAPYALGSLIWRALANSGYWERFGERYGIGGPRLSADSIWIHAVSVGEVQAASTLVRSLMRRYPGVPLVVTTVTPTAARLVQDLFGETVLHIYLPYDFPGAVRRFYDRIRPKLAIVIETELWPNLFHECGRRRIPLVLASARISPKTVARYRWFVSLFREALTHGIVIAAQSDRDAERFKSIGARPDRTHVTGNIKFDFELPASVKEAGEKFRADYAPDRLVWVAASTHEGEEEQVLDAFDQLDKRLPGILLCLVPRHPERFTQVAQLLTRRGYDFETRSGSGAPAAKAQVFLVDTLGELPVFYAASDVAFVGGSLVPIGGHNLLEPAALGLPSLTGTYNFNAEDICELLIAVGACRMVHNAGELAAELENYFRDPDRRRHDGESGLKAVKDNRGTLDRLMALLGPLLADPPPVYPVADPDFSVTEASD